MYFQPGAYVRLDGELYFVRHQDENLFLLENVENHSEIWLYEENDRFFIDEDHSEVEVIVL
jgi:hypothetical protein